MQRPVCSLSLLLLRAQAEADAVRAGAVRF